MKQITLTGFSGSYPMSYGSRSNNSARYIGSSKHPFDLRYVAVVHNLHEIARMPKATIMLWLNEGAVSRSFASHPDRSVTAFTKPGTLEPSDRNNPTSYKLPIPLSSP